jgi:hypothetical protein
MVDLLLRKQAGSETWQRLRVDDLVHGTDELTCLPGYRSDVRLKSGVRLLLWGDLDLREPVLPVLESRVVLHEPPRGIDLDLSVGRGRVLLANDKTQGEAVVRVRCRDNCWEARLPGKDSELAIELRDGYLLGAPLRLTGSGPLPVTVLNFIARGGAEVKVLKAPSPGPNPENLTFRLLGADAAEAHDLWPQLPAWWAGTIKEPQGEALAILKQLSAYVDQAPTSASEQLATAWKAGSLPALSQTLAVFALGAVDNLPALVDTLDDPRPAAREAGFTALRQWLGRDGDNDRKTFDYLKTRQFSEQRARSFMQWLHGFAESERRSAVVAGLLEGLADPSLAFRHLAAHRLAELAPPPEGKVNYDPAADPAARGRAIQEWRQALPPELKP